MLAKSLTADALAAIAAEASFYGLPDLENALKCSGKGLYEYKYLCIQQCGYSGSTSCYDPQVLRDGDGEVYVRYWQDVGAGYQGSESKPPSGPLGPDPGNLLHLHKEGWQYLDSQLLKEGLSMMVVLRRECVL